MEEHSYLESLKNKEFLILKKLCDESLSEDDKERTKLELEEVREEIKKLG